MSTFIKFYIRYLFTIITFLIYLSSFGQELNSIKSRLNLLETEIDFKLDSTGISKLLVPFYDCAINKTENNWHVQDLNNDGLQDLIYSGTCQPYYQTAIFLNSQKGFKLVHDSPGKLIAIRNNPSGIKINILKSSCCCDNNFDLIEVSISNNFGIQKNTISFHFETKIVVSNKLNIRTVSGILRSTSIVENTIKKDACSDNTSIGNQIDLIQNKSVIVLNEKKNWFLVLIKKSNTHSIVGWMHK